MTKFCLILMYISCAFAVALSSNAKVAPVISPMISNRIFNEDTDFSIICALEKGSQPLNFQWLKDGFPLLPTLPNIKIIDQIDASLSRLQFKLVKAENQGNYTCVVNNESGSDSFSISIAVKVAPKWLIEPKDTVISRDNDLSLECNAVASPKPIIFWRKRNSNIVFEGRVLNVNNVKESDGGEYECVVSSKEGELLKKTVNVIVSVPAKFEEKYKLIHSKKGQNARLPCEAIGEKPLSISWTKDDKPLNKRDHTNFEIVDHITERGLNSELVIRNVQRSDNGEYRCLAENEFGSDHRKVKLIVVELPNPPMNVKIMESWSRSASVSWSPDADGHSPITKYTIRYWIHQTAARRLHEFTTTSIQTMALIKDLKPGLSYEIVVLAENDIGLGDPSEPVIFTTNKEEPSGPPMDINVKPAGPTTVKVTWKAPPKDQWNGDLEGYYIGYRAVGSQQPFSFRSEIATPNKDMWHEYEFFLTNLLTSTTYDIVLKAFNSAGSGPQSHEVQVKTLDGDLPSAPKAFVVSTTKTTVGVSWTTQETQTDKLPIIAYTIHYQRENEDWREFPVPMATVGLQTKGFTHSFTLDNLESGIRYNIFVTATNKNGEGDPSPIVIARTGEDKQPFKVAFGNFGAPYYMQPMFVIPIIISFVIVFIVIAVTIVCVRRLKPPVIPNDGFNTLSTKQFAYVGTLQPGMDLENSKPLMNECGNSYPLPYSTMPMNSSGKSRNSWDNSMSISNTRNSLNKGSHIYDNPQ